MSSKKRKNQIEKPEDSVILENTDKSDNPDGYGDSEITDGDNKEETKEEIKKTEKPKDDAPLVPLVVFLAAGTAKVDQTAGFKFHAKKNKLGPMAIKQWRSEFQKFMKRPIN